MKRIRILFVVVVIVSLVLTLMPSVASADGEILWQIGVFDESRGELKGSGLEGKDVMDFYVGTPASEFPSTLYLSTPSTYDYRGVHVVNIHFSIEGFYKDVELIYGRAGDEKDYITLDGEFLDEIAGTENSWNGSPYTIEIGVLSPGNHVISIEVIDNDILDDAHVVDALKLEGTVVEEYVSGGGHLLEIDGAKRKDWLDISFGGGVAKLGAGEYIGEWEVNFHNVGVEGFDQSKFHTTNITDMNFYAGNDQSCHAALNFTAYGEWNGIPGYKMIFRAGDSCEPNGLDTVRVELYGEGTKVYDTTFAWAGEFKNESDCVGTARTGLDTGNITIEF